MGIIVRDDSQRVCGFKQLSRTTHRFALTLVVTVFALQIKKRRGAREAEGAPLLREYRVKSLIEGSNPSLSARYTNGPDGPIRMSGRRDAEFVRQLRLERIRTVAGGPECSEGEAHGRASNPFLPRQETELLAPFFVGAD